MLCFHGTTKKGLKSLLDGDNYKHISPWTCSDNDGFTYLWPAHKIAKNNGYNDIDDIMSEGIRSAFDSASVQSLFDESKELFVLVCNVPKKYLQDDYSCDNMADIASFMDSDNWDRGYIKQVFKIDFNVWYKPVILSGLLHNPQFNRWGVDENLLELAEKIASNDLYLDIDLDNYYEIDLENC